MSIPELPEAELLPDAGAARPKRPQSDVALIRRFWLPARRDVRRLLATSDRFVDLARVFPAAVHALAVAPLGSRERDAAVRLVTRGASLRAVAASLSLPLWLRRLPPEAFAGPIPELPHGDSFARRIANRLPRPDMHPQFWLDAIAFAARWGSEDFAIWVAAQPIHGTSGQPDELLGALTLYAWLEPMRQMPVRRLVAVPWRPELGIETAVCAAKSWLNRVRLVLQLPPGVLTDPWFEPGIVNGYRFEPLLDCDALLAEARSMQNCTDQYAERLARDRCRLFSVCGPGGRVATLEVGPHQREVGILAITQLKARHNMPASLEVWQAALHWAGTQRHLRRIPRLAIPERPLEARGWNALVHGYAQDRGEAPWLQAATPEEALGNLERGLASLAARAGVTSWLFT